MSLKFEDYYKILGVARDASQAEIKKAFREIARKNHPDVNKAPEADKKFKAANEAYEVLKDPDKRKKYDELGANWKAGQDFRPPPGFEGFRGGGGQGGFRGQPGGFSDFFEMFFNQQGGGGNINDLFEQASQRGRGGHARRPQQPRAVEAEVSITLADAYHGGSRSIALQDPQTGSSRSLDVKIPRGVTSGSKIRLSGAAPGGGDLILKIHIAPDARFTVHGHNLEVDLPITPWEAALGSKVPLKTLNGDVTLSVPAGAQSGQKMRLRGKGLPKDKAASEHGDLLAKLKIAVPKELTDDERELLEQLRDKSEFNPRE